MTLFMPPIQRKKKVPEKYNPDSYRVISEDAVSDHPKYRPLPYRASFEPPTPSPNPVSTNNNAVEDCYDLTSSLKNTKVLPQILPDYRAHRPHARTCGFLDRNVRFLNEPICNVYTKPVQHEEKAWWPARANPGELVIPPYAEDSNYRIDYSCRHGNRPSGSGRHTAHTEREAALGTVPVNYLRERDGSKRFYKEAVSYEHMYNSRIDPSYPIRGKRHGAFVWNKMDPISQKKFIEYYQRLEEEEKSMQEAEGYTPSCHESKSATPFVARSANNNNKNGTSSPKRRSSSSSVINGQKSARESAKSVSVAKEHAQPVVTEEPVCPPCNEPKAASVEATTSQQQTNAEKNLPPAPSEQEP